MNRLHSSWRRKGYGISFGNRSEDQLCNLRFADDLLVFAASRSQLGKMITDLSSAVGAIGLELRMGKTKVLTNTDAAGYIEVKGSRIPIIELTEYLGRLLSFKDTHDVEIDARIAKGWRKFVFKA
jgi:hypothetical protein